MSVHLFGLLALAASEGASQSPTHIACDALRQTRMVSTRARAAAETTSQEGFRREVMRMRAPLKSLSPFDMLPRNEEQVFPDHSRRLFRFLAIHREVVRETNAGRYDIARNLLGRVDRGDHRASRRALRSFWGCDKETGNVQAETERPDLPTYDAGVPKADPRDAASGPPAAPFGVENEAVPVSHAHSELPGGDGQSSGTAKQKEN
ncbi:MAG: hypothetical protein AAGA69_01155, partial [Pseudomonadota bacterium]